MERFDFFFGLHLGGRLHSHTNNLSKDLQGTDWRLVLVHQATPKLPKITLEGSIMRLLILSSVLSIRKASAPTPRWRPSWLKLLMVTTMRQSSSFLKHHTEKMLIQGRYLGMQLSTLEVMLWEKMAVSVFWRNPVGGVKVSRTRKEANSESPNYL